MSSALPAALLLLASVFLAADAKAQEPSVLAASTSGSAEAVVPDAETDAGVGDDVLVTRTNGMLYAGTITSIANESLSVDIGGKVVSLARSEIRTLEVRHAAPAPAVAATTTPRPRQAAARRPRRASVLDRGSLGAGFGIPYGLNLGVNGDLALHPHVELTAGLGTTIFAGPAYEGGVKLFIDPPSKWVRRRVLAVYGVNGLLVVQGSENFTRTYLGLTVGGGLEVNFGGRHGFDVDLLFRATTGGIEDDAARYGEPDRDRVTFSTGYRFRF